jgi:hypothetical protein
MISRAFAAGAATGCLLLLTASFDPARAAAAPDTLRAVAAPETLRVATVARAPRLDGIPTEDEYGTPTLELPGPYGPVRAWFVQAGDSLYVAAVVPDTAFYWGDDFSVLVDADGSGGDAPALGDRSFVLRRTADSTVVLEAPGNGRWEPAGGTPSLGSRRAGKGWRFAVHDAKDWWSTELVLDARPFRTVGRTYPRIAFRTASFPPLTTLAWPKPPEGVRPSAIGHRPSNWGVLVLAPSDALPGTRDR